MKKYAKVHKTGLSYLVKGNCHDPVGGVKGLFDTVAVVDVDIDVNHALMIFQKFENSDDDVVDVAKAGRFRLLGVMKSSGPVDGDVGLLLVQFHSPGNGTTRRDLAEFVQPVKYGAVFAYVEALKL